MFDQVNPSQVLGREAASSDYSDQEEQIAFYNGRDLLLRIAQHCEFLGLYGSVNEQIIAENPRQDRLFLRVTEKINEIIKLLKLIEIKIEFSHPWFPSGKFLSFWTLYNKLNEVGETDNSCRKKLYIKFTHPTILKNESNEKNVQKLLELSVELNNLILQSTTSSCCCIATPTYVFGRLD